MKITYLLLRGFKRFPFLAKSEFELKKEILDNKLIIIQGINGSGKSSLLNELTPLPSDKNDFNKNGYKEIHIRHNNNLYKLICDFSTNNYYFYLNDENLNISCNISTQKELVEKHFNITSNIHNLLIGLDNFTELSLLQRKKLFSFITHLNLDSILNNYNILKEELKNNEVLLKNYLNLIKAEENKLQNKNHLNEINIRLTNIKQFIDFLIEFRNEIVKYKNNSNLKEIYNEFFSLYTKIDNAILKYYIPLTSYSKDTIYNLKSKLELVTYKLNDYYKKLEKEQTNLKILEENKNKNIDLLKSELQNKIEYSKNLYNSIIFLKNIEKIELIALKNAIYKLEVNLPEVLNELPLNINKEYNKENFNNLILKKENLLKELQKLINQENNLYIEINKIESTQYTFTCPKCNHNWKIDNIVNLLEENKKQLEIIIQTKLELNTELEKIDKKIEEINNYFNLIKIYYNLKNTTENIFKSFWNYIEKEELLFLNPKEILNKLKILNNDIIALEEYINLNTIINNINKNIIALQTIENNDITEIKLNIENLTLNIENIFSEKKTLEENIFFANKFLTLKSTLKNLINNLDTLKENLQLANLSYLVSNLIEIIDNELSKNKVTLIELEKEVLNYNNIQYTIDNYNKQIENIKEDIEVLNILLKELSPKDGLIAKYVSNFLNVILNNINNIIISVWEYDMKLNLLELDNGDILDYKFKVIVGDNELIINDINKVSSGMKEIINLAFRITLYKLLQLKDSILYLDEFGVKLDKQHKQKILHFISNIIHNNIYEQVFLISHIDYMLETIKDSVVIELS